jgi:hypothetical protein
MLKIVNMAWGPCLEGMEGNKAKLFDFIYEFDVNGG